MSDFTISIPRGSNPTQEHIDKVMDLLRQCRSDDDIRRDNAEAQRECEAERDYGWSVR